MKRVQVLFAAVACACLAPAVFAQFGTNFFRKPNIANIFQPVVGTGSQYLTTSKDGKTNSIEMSVVGKEMVDGKEGYWMEIGHMDERSGTMMYVKMLVTKDDFQFHRMVFEMPGSSQPMEMPINPNMQARQRMKEEMEKWHSAGTEPVTVPAGTFLCEHWTKDSGKGDVWVSTKVSPVTMVKSENDGETMVLSKIITDAKDHIPGTPLKFDPQMMRQMMMQQMNKDKQ
jgi:hypothetical protein